MRNNDGAEWSWFFLGVAVALFFWLSLVRQGVVSW